jgi:hypothetical protein
MTWAFAVPAGNLGSTGGIGWPWGISPASSLFRWNGSSWTEVRERVPGARHIWSGGDSDLWVAAGSNGIHHFDGSTWTTTATSYHSVLAVWGSAPNDVWAAGGEHIDCSDCGGVLHWNRTEWYRRTRNSIALLFWIWREAHQTTSGQWASKARSFTLAANEDEDGASIRAFIKMVGPSLVLGPRGLRLAVPNGLGKFGY